jgi:hypothetical protein
MEMEWNNYMCYRGLTIGLIHIIIIQCASFFASLVEQDKPYSQWNSLQTSGLGFGDMRRNWHFVDGAGIIKWPPKFGIDFVVSPCLLISCLIH